LKGVSWRAPAALLLVPLRDKIGGFQRDGAWSVPPEHASAILACGPVFEVNPGAHRRDVGKYVLER
jgi:hypothetical protein